MKGIVFKEFLDLVENKFGEETAEEIIESSELKSGGAYTSVGTYDYKEVLELVTKLSEKTGIAVKDLVVAFGQHLVGAFYKGFPDFFSHKDSFSFLETIDNVIHVEVKKLYPDAELPKFESERPSDQELKLTYSSKRPFSALAEGLIKGTIEHYNEKVKINIEDTSEGTGTGAVFILTRG